MCLDGCSHLEKHADKVRVTLLHSDKDAVVEHNFLTEPGMRPRSTAEAAQQPYTSTNGASRHSAYSDREGGAAAARLSGGERDAKRARGTEEANNSRGTGAHERSNDEGGKSKAGGGARGGSEKSERRPEARRPKSWLREGIRVRVVNKKLKSYMSKAVILNVLGHAHCSIKLEEKGSVLDVRRPSVSAAAGYLCRVGLRTVLPWRLRFC